MKLRVTVKKSTYSYPIPYWTDTNISIGDLEIIHFHINGENVCNVTGATWEDITTPIDCGDNIIVQSVTFASGVFTFIIDGLGILDNTTFGVHLTSTGGVYDGIDRLLSGMFTIYGYDLGRDSGITLTPPFILYLTAVTDATVSKAEFITYRNPVATTPTNGEHLAYYACSNITRSESCTYDIGGAPVIITEDGSYYTQAQHVLTLTTGTLPLPTGDTATYMYGNNTQRRWFVDDILQPYYVLENPTCNDYEFTPISFEDNGLSGTATINIYQFDGLSGGTAIWTEITTAAVSAAISGTTYDYTPTTDGVFKIVYSCVNPENDKQKVTYNIIILAKCNTIECILSKLPDLICCKATNTCKEVDYYQFNSMAMTVALAGVYFYQMGQLTPNGAFDGSFLYRLQDVIDRIASFCSNCNSPCDCSNDCNCIQEQSGCF